MNEQRGYIKRIKNLIRVGDSLAFLVDRSAIKELELEEGDEIVAFFRKKPQVKEFFCSVDNHYFTSDDSIEEVSCPICGATDTVKEIMEDENEEN